MRSRISLLLVVICSVLLTAETVAASRQVINPLLPSGPDPWVTFADGYYYYTSTGGNELRLWKTRDIARLATAQNKQVWIPPAEGPNSASIWAPELHRIGGTWYLYYTASDRAFDDDAHRHVFVLENKSADPLSGTWVDRGMLATEHTGIDGTVFFVSGRWYFAYSAYVGPDSHLILAEMENPWTLSKRQVDIAGPTYDWEKRGGRQILEGPEFLPGPKGDRFLVYSASACWSDDYGLGMLRAAPDADLLDPRSWQKASQPVFRKSEKNGVYAPGHNGFFTSPNGRETWIIYHANSAAGQGCTAKRAPRIQKIGWKADGSPDFGEPVAAGLPIDPPQ